MCSIIGYSGLVTAFVPPGWPTGVQPPESPDFERSAATWLLDVVPSDYLLHGVLRRHPIALAALARHHLNACVQGARSGYRTARSELGPHLPPSAVEAVLAAYRSEGGRLASAARAADLVERALHGEVFVRQMSGGARPSAPGRASGPASARTPGPAPAQGPAADRASGPASRAADRPGAPGRVRSRDRPAPSRPPEPPPAKAPPEPAPAKAPPEPPPAKAAPDPPPARPRRSSSR